MDMAGTERRRRGLSILYYLILAAIFAVGVYASWIRFSKGLGAATNLSDNVPWGLWIWLNLAEISVCASGFILCAFYFAFNIERLKPIVRPAVLSTFLGYSLVAATLLYDIGMPLRFWHPLLMWNHQSVMLEVALCIMFYLGVLAAEMSIPVTEGMGWSRLTAFLRNFCVILSILGAMLSVLHQSSLGALFLIVPEKLNPIWYSSWLPWLFLSSAAVGGIGFIVFELALGERFLGHRLSVSIYSFLGRLLLGTLSIYLVMLIADFSRLDKWLILFERPHITAWFAVEVMLGTVLPLILLLSPRVRESRSGVIFCAVTAGMGVLFNRLNVTLVGLLSESGASYFPTWQEFAIVLMIIALRVILTAAASRRFPIFEKERV